MVRDNTAGMGMKFKILNLELCNATFKNIRKKANMDVIFCRAPEDKDESIKGESYRAFYITAVNQRNASLKCLHVT